MARLLIDDCPQQKVTETTYSSGDGQSSASSSGVAVIPAVSRTSGSTSKQIGVGLTAAGSGKTSSNLGGMSTARKLSFKLKTAGGASQSRPTIRAHKVTVSSNTVSSLANKYNAVIIQNDAQGRALLKRLNSSSSKKSTTCKPREGVVKAAVQKLETNRSNHDRPKIVVVRKTSSNKYKPNKPSPDQLASLPPKLKNFIKSRDIPKDRQHPSNIPLPSAQKQINTKKVDRGIHEIEQNKLDDSNNEASRDEIKNVVLSKLIEEFNSKSTDQSSKINQNNNNSNVIKSCLKTNELHKISDSAKSDTCIKQISDISDCSDNLTSRDDFKINSKTCVTIPSTSTNIQLKTNLISKKTFQNSRKDEERVKKSYYENSNSIIHSNTSISEENPVTNSFSSARSLKLGKDKLDSILRSCKDVPNEKPELQPKPKLNDRCKTDSIRLSASSMENVAKPELLLNIREKKLSLAKDQSVLESALNESSSSSSETVVSPVKSSDIKPNSSFLWRNLSFSENKLENGIKIVNSKDESSINSENISNSGSNFKVDSKDQESRSDMKSDSCSDRNPKCNLSKDNINKSSLYKTADINNPPVDSSTEDKENDAKAIERFENTKNNVVKPERKAFLYRNAYNITQAINPKMVEPQEEAKNDSANNYEELNSVYYVPKVDPRLRPCEVKNQVLYDSKLSYGYVDPDNQHYEDTSSHYACIPGSDENGDYLGTENIYDDVMNVRAQVKELEDHYEWIDHPSAGGGCAKDSSGESSCDQSNSLYGLMMPPAVGGRPSSRTSSLSCSGVYDYGCGRAVPKSETSDEWMDVENSDQEEILVIKRGVSVLNRTRRNASAASGWCEKVRRQRNKTAIAAGSNIHHINYDGSDSGSNSYESVPNQRRRPIAPCENSDDSYESDSSFEDICEYYENSPPATADARRDLPVDTSRVSLPASQNDGIYGFMKQAGRKIKKWPAFGSSLSRIRKLSVSSASTQGVQSSVTNGDDSSSGSGLNRMRWSSFKSRFKAQTSVPGSTFYIYDDDRNSQKSLSPKNNRHNDSTPNRLDDSDRHHTPPPGSVTADKRGSLPSDYFRQNMPVTVDSRRLSTSSSTAIRPTSPPPPPPTHINKKSPPSVPPPNNNASNGTGVGHSNFTSTPIWYSDSGSEHSSSHGSDLNLRFADEPLYQFYNATVCEEELNFCYSSIDGDVSNERSYESSDGYEEIGDHHHQLSSRPSAMELINPRSGQCGRRLWCEIPQIRNSEILRSMSKDERRLQEAKFEVMTSEASYLKSLNVLEKHFASSHLLKDESVLCHKDWKSLFGHVESVRKCSKELLSKLEKCWQESVMLDGICDILYAHAFQQFHVYISYCSNQIGLNSTLKTLKESNKRFEEALTRLEGDPKCESLSLHSFLMLPMQRITRMPLLVDAILSKLDVSHSEYSASEKALKTLNNFVQKCNEETRQQERVIEMLNINRCLEFAKDVKTIPIVSKTRWLVRSGQLLQLGTDSRQTFGRKFTKQGTKITLFLFNDLLLLAKRKSDDTYLVIDHCQKNLLEMSGEDDMLVNSYRHLIKLALLKNHEDKLVELILSCDTETCRQRWLQAVAPPTSDVPGEAVYEVWDCPQVVSIHTYVSVQPDELSLQKGDVIKVLRKMTDGWYYGERTRDGETGWFPGNHVHEIVSAHVRARNLHQRYRLLTLSGRYLLEQQQQQNQYNPKRNISAGTRY